MVETLHILGLVDSNAAAEQASVCFGSDKNSGVLLIRARELLRVIERCGVSQEGAASPVLTLGTQIIVLSS